MKPLHIFILSILTLVCASCSVPGYYDDGYGTVAGRLTGSDWVLVSVTYPDSPTEDVSAMEVFCFEPDGRGWRELRTSPAYEDVESVVEYFAWDFTTDNCTVLRLWGSYSSFWLIDRLTSDELRVTAANRDPVLSPNDYKVRYVFKGRPI